MQTFMSNCLLFLPVRQFCNRFCIPWPLCYNIYDYEYMFDYIFIVEYAVMSTVKQIDIDSI